MIRLLLGEIMALEKFFNFLFTDPLVVVLFIICMVVAAQIITISMNENFDRDCLYNMCPACKTDFTFKQDQNLLFLEKENDDYLHVSCPNCYFGHKINKNHLESGQYDDIKHLIKKNN